MPEETNNYVSVKHEQQVPYPMSDFAALRLATSVYFPVNFLALIHKHFPTPYFSVRQASSGNCAEVRQG